MLGLVALKREKQGKKTIFNMFLSQVKQNIPEHRLQDKKVIVQLK